MKMLRGTRVLISLPEMKKQAIELSEKDKALLEAEARKSWTQLSVFAIGDKVEDVKEGDKVYVRASALELSERIEIEGQMKLMVHEQDIAIVW